MNPPAGIAQEPLGDLEVTTTDVERVAQKYINPATMQVVAVGDASNIKTVMEKFGPVEMVDASGKPPVEPTKSNPSGGLEIEP